MLNSVLLIGKCVVAAGAALVLASIARKQAVTAGVELLALMAASAEVVREATSGLDAHV